MAIHAALLSGLALMAQAPAAGAPLPVVLACDIPARATPGTPTAAPAERIFRVSPGSFQEWDASLKKFGSNLCSAYTCVKTPDRSEGTIGSASVTYTVGVVHGTGEGYWRAMGASGLAAKEGPCRVVAEPKP